MILKIYDYFNLDIDYAKGVCIYSKDGKKYLDTFAGIGVMAFGHSNNEILEAMKSKMERYMHISNFYLDEDAVYVANKLIEFTGKKGEFFLQILEQKLQKQL
nr:aminotransferase class III-fold pyridoxal phosphate-dependent enzyme [Marinitoga lauensis]